MTERKIGGQVELPEPERKRVTLHPLKSDGTLTEYAVGYSVVSDTVTPL